MAKASEKHYSDLASIRNVLKLQWALHKGLFVQSPTLTQDRLEMRGPVEGTLFSQPTPASHGWEDAGWAAVFWPRSDFIWSSSSLSYGSFLQRGTAHFISPISKDREF